jgi:hypothetical protein
MDHVLTEHGLRLSYLCDKADIDSLDMERLLDDFNEGTPAGEAPVWGDRRFLSDYAHVILAYDLGTGRALGLLGAQDIQTGCGPVLLLETGFVVASARGQNLMRRMIALALLRIAGLESLPAAIVVATQSPVGCRILRTIGGRLRGSCLAPEPDGALLRFESARLLRAVADSLGLRPDNALTRGALYARARGMRGGAHRLSHDLRTEHVLSPVQLAEVPMLVALDLRQASEASVLADARQLYRLRPGRSLIPVLPAVERNPFWPAARVPDALSGITAAS